MYRIFLVLTLWCQVPFFSLTAQALFVGSGQHVYITADTQVALQGDLYNEGTITHQGTLSLTGDWRDEQIFTAQAGSRVILSGDDQQITAGAQEFSTLVIQGGGTKTCLSPTRIRDSLRLSRGIIAAATSGSITLGVNAVAEGGSDESYVEQSMQHEGANPTFPLGIDGQYTPISLQNIVGNSPVIQTRVVTPNPPITPGPRIARLSPARYWEVTTTAGSLESAQAALSINAGDGFEDLLGVVVAQSVQPGGNFTNMGQSASEGDISSGTITSQQAVTQPVLALALTTEFSVANQVLVPSVFSPDAINSVDRSLPIYAATLLPDRFSWRIFNRWGDLVYQTSSLEEAISQGWNGLYQSDRSPAEAGVYQYHLQGIYESGDPVSQSGTITLLR